MIYGSKALLTWLATQFKTPVLTPASTDASNRFYYRLTDNNITYIVMDSSQEKTALSQFLVVQNLLKSHNIAVPKVFNQNTDLGFLVLEDLGTTDLLSFIKTSNSTKIYQTIIDVLLDLQKIPLAQCLHIPYYTPEILAREIQLFPEWFLTQDIDLSNEFNWLITQINQQAKTLTHRDYHSRNIMLDANNKPALIDFQDALIGSYVYDLCSLLKDAYYQLPKAILLDLLKYYHQHCAIEILFKDFIRDFELISIQRQLKVLGIFTRLSVRDSKHQYLDDIVLVKTYLLDTLPNYPELSAVYQTLKDKE